MAGVTEEVAKVAGGFVDVMRVQPLALALVIMNLVLLGYLFYLNSSINAGRKESVDLVIGWQKETDKLMASCVSYEVSRMMMDNMQKITDTMLSAEQKEITRMQDAINKEREKSYQLREREADELMQLKAEREKQKRQQQERPQPQNYSPPQEPIRPAEPKLPLPPLPAVPPGSKIKYQE